MVIPRTTITSLIFVAAAGAISACSTTKSHPYNSSHPENVTLTQDLTTGSVELRVYSLDANENASYKGTVQLGESAVRVSIPSDRTSLLHFKFSKYTFATGSYSISQPIYLTPRTGYNYEIKASYIDTMYGVQVMELDKTGRLVREVIQ